MSGKYKLVLIPEDLTKPYEGDPTRIWLMWLKPAHDDHKLNGPFQLAATITSDQAFTVTQGKTYQGEVILHKGEV
jgi:hypothetical protein